MASADDAEQVGGGNSAQHATAETAGEGANGSGPARAGAADDEDEEADDGTPYDEVEDEPLAGEVASERVPHPLDGVSQAEIERRLRDDRKSLGSMSIGLPNSGRLINATQLPESPFWERVAPYAAWATSETVDYLTAALTKVHATFPNSHKLYVGDISAERGGYLAPHLSHQSGRDIDISFFYRKEGAWYRRANADNLDRERTWAFVRALITETDVRFILIDRSLHPLLREYAESIGEDRDWLDKVFRGTGLLRGALVRHAPGHATHLHIRFDSPVAQETARLCYQAMLKSKLIEPPSYFISHKVKKGETLGKLAKRYGTTIPALKKINGLKNSLIRAGRVYKIPRKGNAPPPPPTARLPRVLPPTHPKVPAVSYVEPPPTTPKLPIVSPPAAAAEVRRNPALRAAQ
ncbi:MAG TPA: penicillin-insensitive murein endopeptidase [Polyangiaceae bacterium]|nr:penicillin-insensitive murein endopeptidase [Polyangiaceae bacterium]